MFKMQHYLKLSYQGKNLEQVSTFVKIMQFSPDVLTSIYNRVTDTCFVLGTTAVSKILFKLIFGPCVMLFLFLIYLCQSCVFSMIKIKSNFSNLMKYKLVQSFIFVILLSYQQIVSGAFTLVKCIEIGNKDVLYVQGNIQCFTMWQIIIEVFIWMSIFPSFCVVSHVPYYVKMKEMSAQMFILVCLIPVPGLVIFHLAKALKKLNRRSDVKNLSDIELNVMCDKRGRV